MLTPLSFVLSGAHNIRFIKQFVIADIPLKNLQQTMALDKDKIYSVKSEVQRPRKTVKLE